MCKFLLAAFLCTVFNSTFAQIPILYFDFENNSNRSLYENNCDQFINTPSTLSSAVTINDFNGNGIANGGSVNGTAANVTTLITLLGTDPGAKNAPLYTDFTVNTQGFTGISIAFDYKQNGIAALSTQHISAGYSLDGGTTFTNLNLALPFNSSFNSSSNFNLNSSCNNNATVLIRIYQYVTGLVTLISGFTIDNLYVKASGTVAGKSFTTLNENAIYTSTTSGNTGSLLNRNNFTCTGSNSTITLGSSMAIASGNTFIVENAAKLITESYQLKGAGNFSLLGGGTIFVGNIDGLSSNANSGNICVTGTKSYASGANYVYNNLSATAQQTGNLLPSNITGTLTINNSGSVNLTQATTLSAPATLYLTTGAFTNSNLLAFNAGSTINRDGGSLTATPTFNGFIYLLYTGATAVTTGFEVPVAVDILKDLYIQKTSISNEVTLANDAFVNGTFYSNSGVLHMANNNITLRSTPASTANASITSAGFNYDYNGSGRFIIERYLFAKKAWRFLATPVTISDATSVKDAWQENGSYAATGYGTQITGPASYVGVDQQSPRGSLKSYDMATATFIEVNNMNNQLYNRQGYFVYVRGDRSINSAGITGATNLRIKGKLATGAHAYAVNANKFLSVGNPFASRIDMRNVNFAGGSTNAYTVWNANSAGSYNAGAYETYVKDIATGNFLLNGVGAMQNTIESGQAFFIQATTSAGSFQIDETAKVSGSSLVSRQNIETANYANNRSGNTVQSFDFKLYTNDAAGNSYMADGCVINFASNFENSLDNMDVKKMSNTADNLSIKSNALLLTAERRNLPQVNDSIFLNISGCRVTNYQIEIDPSMLQNIGMTARLYDKFLQTVTNIDLTNITTINYAVTTDVLSKAADRFVIVFKPLSVLPVTFSAISAKRLAINKAVINFTVLADANTPKFIIEKSDNGSIFKTAGELLNISATNEAKSFSYLDEQAGEEVIYYRIKNTDNSGLVKYSNIVKVMAWQKNNEPQILFSFNASNKQLIANGNNLQQGNYVLNIVNNNGQQIYNENVTVKNSSFIFTKNIQSSIAAGIYTVVFTDGTHKKITQQILLR